MSASDPALGAVVATGSCRGGRYRSRSRPRPLTRQSKRPSQATRTRGRSRAMSQSVAALPAPRRYARSASTQVRWSPPLPPADRDLFLSATRQAPQLAGPGPEEATTLRLGWRTPPERGMQRRHGRWPSRPITPRPERGQRVDRADAPTSGRPVGHREQVGQSTPRHRTKQSSCPLVTAALPVCSTGSDHV
jgi:hypothetical protein